MKFKEFKEKWGPCADAVEYIEKLDTDDCREILGHLIAHKKFDWAEWGLVRFLPTKDVVEWACLCAESVLPIFEKAFPNDDRPRKAIEAARSGDAAWAAWAAARADAVEDAAADAAAWAAWAAADAAARAAARADAAADAAARAADAAADAAARAAAWAARAAADVEAHRGSLLLLGVGLLKGTK